MKWIYSVSVSVPKPLRDDWLTWMHREHIPDVMATGFFDDFLIQELVEPVPYPDMFTFNVQYFCATEARYQQYQATASTTMQQKTKEKFGDKLQIFRTVLTRIS